MEKNNTPANNEKVIPACISNLYTRYEIVQVLQHLASYREHLHGEA